MRAKKIIGIVSVVSAVLIAVILAVTSIMQMAGRKDVVVTNKNLPKGQIITEADVTTMSINKGDVKENYILKKEDIVGKFASVDLVASDILSTSKVSDKSITGDSSFLSIPSGKQAISFKVEGGPSSLSNKLLTGDIIRVYTYDKERNENDRVYSPAELQFVQVANITSSAYKDVDEKSKEGTDKDKNAYSTITVIVAGPQVEKLVELQKEGGIYVSLISRGNETVANQLLAQQDAVFKD